MSGTSHPAQDGPPVTVGEKHLIGYSSELSASSGQQIDFMVSAPDAFEASIVRLRHEPGSGDSPRYSWEQIASVGRRPAHEQTLKPGSRVHVQRVDGLLCPQSFTISAWVLPTLLGDNPQMVLGCWNGDSGFGLFVSSAGLTLRVGRDGNIAQTPPLALPNEPEWCFVAAAYEHETGIAEVVCRPYADGAESLPGQESSKAHSFDLGVGVHNTDAGSFTIGGADAGSGTARWSFNGKIEDPRLLRLTLKGRQLVDMHERDAWRHWATDVVGAWDFSLAIMSSNILDMSGNSNTGVLVNLPARAMTGRNWSGEVAHWSGRPEEYGAIHFHDDDLGDASWEPSFSFVVPADLPSGAYAAHLTSKSESEFIPFWVCPQPGNQREHVAFLASTLTDIAYGNSHEMVANPWLSVAVAGIKDIGPLLSPEDHAMLRLGLLSQYDKHSDGSGVCYASRRRPILSMRPGYLFPSAQSYHGFSADLCALRWMEEKDISYEILTDEVLHAHGASALAPYRTIVTGSHPEYWTRPMMTALQAYIREGGRVMYLGGNGFHWVTSIPEFDPTITEVRRNHFGAGPSEAGPGESGHSTTGEPGGLWRHHGHNSFRITGTATAAFGCGPARPYTRTPASYEPEVSWIFDGVATESFGESGRFLGGAGGWEIDRTDARLGTPMRAKVLATAEGFSEYYQRIPEVPEIPTLDQHSEGPPPIHADLVYLDHRGGGAVFGVNSLCWLGALEADRYAGSVSRITENVLRRFCSDPATSDG